MEIITHEHEQYDAIVAVWEANKKARRVHLGSVEYMAVKDDDAVKFVPVAPSQSFGGGYASQTFTDGAGTSPQASVKPRKSSSKSKVESDGKLEGTVSD